MTRKVAALLMAAVLLGAMAIPAYALEAEAPSAILMHTGGKVLYEKNPHEKLEPASVTKIMTLLLAMEALDSGAITLEDVVTASKHASSMGGSQVWMKEGEQFTVHELLKCIAVASANDCSVALAEHISGTEETFVEKMNQRAAQLGMENTRFANCSGLTAAGHLTTAYDVALMSIELLKHDKVQEYTLIWQDTIRDGAFGLDNTNKLVHSFEGITGLKTGSTSTAGACISATASRDGLDLVAVIMKGESSAKRNEEAAKMLNFGFANYAAVSLTPDTPLMPIPVSLGKEEYVRCALADSEPGIYEKSKLAAVEKEVVMEQSLTAPVAQGQVVGKMTVRAEGEIIAQVDIIAESAVEKKGFFDIFADLLMIISMRVI